MKKEEYAIDFCSRCKKCDGSAYHRYHCTDNDILDEAWDAGADNVIERACRWIELNRAHFWYDNGNVIEQFKKAMEEENG